MQRTRMHRTLSLVIAVVMVLAWVPVATAAPTKAVNEQVKLQLLAINDFHGQIIPYSLTLGGLAMLGGYLDERDAQVQAQNGVTWRLGAGDLIGASPAISGLLQDEPTLDALDSLKFSYSAVGNHEFDEGYAELLRLQYGGVSPVTGDWEGLSHLQYLSANVIRTDTGDTLFPPYAIEYAKGIPVGIIGVGYENSPMIVTASGVAGLEFLDEAEAVNDCVAELKAQGVEAIIVLLHDGGSGNTSGGTISGDIVPVVEAMDDEVDVVLSAHSHQRYWGTIDGKLVTQAHSSGRAFADVDLVLDRATGDVVSKTAEIVTVTIPNDLITPDKQVAKIVARAAAIVAPIVNEVVATAASDMTRTSTAAGESELGDLIAEAQRWQQGTDIAFMNPGGIRNDLMAGEVTWGELFAVQPFSNYLVTMKMTGAQIDAVLEQQLFASRMLQIAGITYSWSASAPAGSKIDPASIMVGGVPLDLTATYTVTANQFLADGGDGFTVFKNATDKMIWGTDLDALVGYVKQLPQPFDQAIDGRITMLP